MEKCISGFCPCINNENEIKIHYSYVPVIGNIHDNYKKGNFLCDYINDCSYGNENNCPLYNNAQTIIVE